MWRRPYVAPEATAPSIPKEYLQMRHVTSVFLLIVLTTPLSRAQTTAGGSITGVARDEQGAVLPGVTVTATGESAPGVYRATTTQTGEYRLADLPPGEYTLSAALDQFAAFVRKAIAVRAGMTVVVNVEMKVGAIGETVEVRSESPLLETRSGGHSVNVSGDLLRSVPLLEGREWYGALAAVPGIVTFEFAGSKQFYVRGSDPTATIVHLDGADVTGAAKTSVTYLQLNTDAVADIQIQTGGIRASAPLGSGGIVNVVTASGTNTVKGAGTLFAQPRAWNDSNQPGGTSGAVEQTQIDLSLGGPLLKDRLWAFGAYRRTNMTIGVSRSQNQLETLRGLVPTFEPLDNKREANFWLAKLTAQTGRHHLSGFYQKDENPYSEVLSNAEKPFTQNTGGAAVSARISSVWSNRLTTTLVASYNDKDRDNPPSSLTGPVTRVFDSTIVSAGRPLGNGHLATLGPLLPWRLTQPNEKTTASFDTTFYAAHGRMSHELQAGVYFEDRTNGNHLSYINDGYIVEEYVLRQRGAPAGGSVPFHRTVMNGTELTTFNQRARDFAVYVQDSWRPMSRLTLTGGIRMDRIAVDDPVFGTTPQRSVDVGPRASLNYALTNDNRNIARAYWTRVHDQPGVVTTAGNPTIGQRDLYDADLDGTFETVFVTPPSTSAIANRMIDPDLHQPYVQEWGAGFSRQFAGSTTFNLDVARRRFTDRPTLVELNGRFDGRVFAGYRDETFNEIYQATNNRWNTPVYTSLELSATKQTQRVQALASYVRQWRHIDGTWQPNDPASFIQPDAFPNNTGIGSSTGSAASNTDANSLVGHHMTQAVTASSQWQDHVVRAAASVVAPWALTLSANYTFQSGTWSGPIVTRINAPDPAFGPPTLRLSNGRAVSNPLATVIRFAYDTRGEGQLRTPALHALNLRTSRRFHLQRLTLDASFDIFNVTNSGADMGFVFGANQTFNPLFGQTTNRQAPRSAQMVLRVAF